VAFEAREQIDSREANRAAYSIDGYIKRSCKGCSLYSINIERTQRSFEPSGRSMQSTAAKGANAKGHAKTRTFLDIVRDV
jgi:hypothetical protein